MIRKLYEDMDGKTLLDKSIELARWLYGDTSNYEMSSESRMDLQIELSKLIAMIEGAQEYYLNVKKESKSRTGGTSSNRHLRYMSESPLYSVTDDSYYDEIAKEVAQYMGYGEEEAYDELQSDPQSIINYLEDEEDYYNNRSLIKKIEKYFM